MKRKLGLFLSSNPSQGGTCQYSITFLKAVKELSVRYTVVVAYIVDSWEGTLTEHGIAGKKLPYPYYARLIALIWRELGLPVNWWSFLFSWWLPIIKQIRAECCDLWLFPAQDCWGYQACVPSLVSILDLMHRYERSFPEVSQCGRFKRLERHYQSICRAAKGIIVDSEIGRYQVLESYHPDPSNVFSLPYVPPEYLFENNVCEPLTEMDLPAKYLFYPAQFWAHKNHDGLLKAIAALVNDIPDIHLILVGEAKGAYDSIMKLIVKLNLSNRVTHFGYVKDVTMRTLYRHARALVMPSFFGPTNIPPLEAMALGCPVAVANNYAMPEQVGDAGMTFDPRSVNELADVIKILWTDDAVCRELSRRGLERSKLWTQEHFNRNLEQIISTILYAVRAT